MVSRTSKDQNNQKGAVEAPFIKSQRGVVEARGDLEVKSDLNFNSPIHRGAAATESTAAPAAAETAGKR